MQIIITMHNNSDKLYYKVVNLFFRFTKKNIFFCFVFISKVWCFKSLKTYLENTWKVLEFYDGKSVESLTVLMETFSDSYCLFIDWLIDFWSFTLYHFFYLQFSPPTENLQFQWNPYAWTEKGQFWCFFRSELFELKIARIQSPSYISVYL